MLKNLTIKNYAIIDNLTIDFEKGFNVFTGETGAGKSIIVGALSYLLKGRSDSTIVKSGKDKAIIEGVFDIKDDVLLTKLKEQDIDVDGDIVVKRVISNDNHNSIKINESNVTLSFLTNLFNDYIDIHSQKDNQYLYSRKNQLSILDRYAKDDDVYKQYLEAYEKHLKANKEYIDLLNSTYNESEIEYFKYDLKELEDANLSLNEEEDLSLKEQRYKSSEKYLSALNEAINLYDNNYGIKENLYSLFNIIDLDDSKIQELSTKIKDIYYDLDEKMDGIKTILNTFNESDFNIEEIEERLYLYSKLKRKHRTDVQGLLDLKDSLLDKIKSFDDRDFVLNEKKNEVDKLFSIMKDKALELSRVRKNAAVSLAKKVIKEGQELLLNNLNFVINFTSSEYTQTGNDEIDFLVSLNKGEDLKPLKAIASGGEVSRLMLALKVVFSKLSNTDLLILDEIDTGVSGKVALAVGEKISKISRNNQVICITHLAPVAACADDHYLIFKEDINGTTLTNVKKLNKNEIINELAIISSTSTDKKALAAAKDLYENSQKLINENR